ncbi:MAG TPA: hypothetical protein VHL11_01555, partial [Phototrophicaceae bacterium]|jgi:hypothetical protein|nr:hypothetical protein [Phototrophicaceae bacterium]
MKMQKSQPVPPVPVTVIALSVLLAMSLIIGAVWLALSGTNTIQSSILTKMLHETVHDIVPYSGSRLMYSDEFRSSRCGASGYVVGYFEIFSAGASMDTVRTYYSRQFQRHGWAENQTTGSVYPSPSTSASVAMQLDLVEPVPLAIGGIQIPPRVLAARSPDRSLYAVVVTGWDADQCPQLNRNTPVPR